MSDMLDPLFLVKVNCLNCESTFVTSRVRPSFKRPVGKDSDFYAHYKTINPEYYVVRVCSYCGFATTESFDERITTAQRQAFLEKIGSKWTMRDYSGKRDWEQAMETFKLGLVCAQIKEEKPRVIAGLLHHIAWLYRERGDQEQENKFLKFALDAYIESFKEEDTEQLNARLMYMIGELNRRLKNYHEAVKWFGRVINDTRIMDAGMIKLSREMWATTREDMLAEDMELPEEMKNS